MKIILLLVLCYIVCSAGIVHETNNIKNRNLPACKNCVHYLPDGGFRGPLCQKFGEKNIVTNEITFESAEKCREDEMKCGEKGSLYVEDSPLIVTWKSFRHSYFFFFTVSFVGILILDLCRIIYLE